MQRLPLSALSMLLLAVAAPAQTDWRQLNPTTTPTARFGHAMTYDIVRDRVVLFGGWDASGRSLNDTWEFDGTTWTKMNPPASPPGRDGHPIAFDLGRNRTVLFGGDANGNISSDTWEWNGATWTQIQPRTVPPARKSHTLTYDPLGGRIVMFGGNGGTAGYFNDTWAWNGVDWTRVNTAAAPTPRIAHCAAWDPVNRGVLVFSGYNIINDTWLFDGTNWKALSPATQPQSRWDSTMATDTLRDRIVLFGHRNDVWEWTGSNWLQRTPATMPPNRLDHDVAFDSRRQRMIMFGGNTSTFTGTWEYGATAVATVKTYGSACRGSAATPSIFWTGLPWIGESFRMGVANIPSAGPALLMLGLSDKQWGATQLPADLTPFGLTGCKLLAEPRFILPMQVANGAGTFDLPIPAHTPLVGLDFFFQTVQADLNANPGNATTSNAAAGVIGAK